MSNIKSKSIEKKRRRFCLVGGPVCPNGDSGKVDDEEGTTTREAAVGDGRSVTSFVHRKGGERALLRSSMAALVQMKRARGHPGVKMKMTALVQ